MWLSSIFEKCFLKCRKSTHVKFLIPTALATICDSASLPLSRSFTLSVSLSHWETVTSGVVLSSCCVLIEQAVQDSVLHPEFHSHWLRLIDLGEEVRLQVTCLDVTVISQTAIYTCFLRTFLHDNICALHVVFIHISGLITLILCVELYMKGIRLVAFDRNIMGMSRLLFIPLWR